MSARQSAAAALANAAQLVADVKAESNRLTIDDARAMRHVVAEAIGWLRGAEELLDPEESS